MVSVHLSDNLPTFVVLPDPKGLPYNAKGNFTAGFLPQSHQGTILDAGSKRPIPDLFPPASARISPTESQSEGLELLNVMNRQHAALNAGRHASGVAHRRLRAGGPDATERPEALEIAHESQATQSLYGLNEPATADFGRRCLLARRLLERGVRFVQIWSGAGGATNNWDNHADIVQPIAAHRAQRRPADRGLAPRPESPWSAG